MARTKLQQGEKTVTLGVRLPSRLHWQIGKVARDLTADGYETTKSELARFILTENLGNAAELWRSQHEPVSYPETYDELLK